MKHGCGLVVAVWVVLVGAYAYLAWPKIHELAPTAIIAVLGGTFAAVLVGSVAGLFTGASDRAALRRAGQAEPRRDGRMEAASGQVKAEGAPLEAPFTGRSCVAYEYDVKVAGASRSEFAGVALTPCVLDAPNGPARVLGWAVLDQFPAAAPDAIDRVRGTSYLKGSGFEPLGVTSVLSVLGELLADDDGAIRKDFRIDRTTIDLQGRTIEERIVPVGSVVTILGRWSSAGPGFAPTGAASMNRIFPGDLASTRARLAGTSVKTFVIGLAFFLALHAILVPMYFLAPNAAASMTRPGPAASVWDERDCDRQQALLAAGANPNERGQDGLTPLMNAARQGAVPCVQNLIAAGAVLEAVDQHGDTAFAHAITGSREDTAAVLRQAGAKDFRIDSDNGRPMTADSAPFAVVQAYLTAVHQGDFETMTRLVVGASLELTKARSADLPLWQSMRPRTPALAEGWMTDDAATLTARGTTPSGERRVCYQLEKRADGWRIRKEWFPE